ncbi:MAG TPA: hypothetical protein VNF26_12320 [Candidatus Baltobacterales bacterium]|nr:hypothetical protein [Candidatus Baltobacterales bacterium]
MTLTRRDLYATIVVAAGLLVAISVTEGWNWPLMKGVRMGIIALGVTGLLGCAVSGWAEGSPSFKDPFMIVAAALGVVALGAGLVGMFANSTIYLLVMMAVIAMLWLLTVAHRLLGSSVTSRRIHPA